MIKDLTSARPYMLRAIHEWMTDNDETPLLVVDVAFPGVEVPPEHVNDGQIVLNISWSATQALQMDNEQVCFEARFNGAARLVSVPVAAVRGIYGRESGQGMMFQDEPDASAAGEVADVSSDSGPDSGPKSGPKPGGGRPGLRVVK